jgi:hypothetical protein
MECILDKRVGKKTRRKEYYEYLVKWKNHPVEDASWEVEASDTEAWKDRAGAHGQESMKVFKPRSMMQEHCQKHKASQRGVEDRWISQHTFWKYFGNVA